MIPQGATHPSDEACSDRDVAYENSFLAACHLWAVIFFDLPPCQEVLLTANNCC